MTSAGQDFAAIAIGIDAHGFRAEMDTLGPVDVPADRYWGAQTQRALTHFAIGHDLMPRRLTHAYALVKKAAAQVNLASGHLSPDIARAIVQAAEEVSQGLLDDHFPLLIWQSGSGTQTNMNLNEVISNRAIQLMGGVLGSHMPVHPNDHVNMSQSSNDGFLTAMHVAAAIMLERDLIPAVGALASTIEAKAAQWADVVKVGRTHLQDAVTMTVGQEWSGYAAQLRHACVGLEQGKAGLMELAAGGTAIGTGINAPPDFGECIAERIADLTGLPFRPASNKFAQLASLERMVAAMAALRGLAVALLKIANDIRWLASGPRCGLGELLLPSNEPGSSIMPGKVNPSLCEALIMICTQVMGEDNAVAFAGSQGNFELNVMRPIVIGNFLHCAEILTDGCTLFGRYTLEGTQLNHERIAQYAGQTVMSVTSLAPVIGYEKAAKIAQLAVERKMPLREAALQTGWIEAEQLDELLKAAVSTGTI